MVNVIQQDVKKVNSFARAVVAKRVAIVTAVTILIQLALSYGWVTPDVSDNVLHWVNSALDALGALVAIAIVHPVVTPTKDPRDAAGNPLIPVAVAETPPVVVNQVITAPEAAAPAEQPIGLLVNPEPAEVTPELGPEDGPADSAL